MKRRVLLICENREDAKNLIPIATEGFFEIGSQYELLFISLDKFYGQNAEKELKQAKVPFVSLPRLDNRVRSLTDQGPLAQLSVILNHSKEIRRLVCNSDAVVCSSPGLLQKTFAAIARESRKPAYCVQSGLVLAPVQSPLRIIGKKLSHFTTGLFASIASMLGVRGLSYRARGLLYSNFTRVFVMGGESKEVLVKMGHHPRQFVVSGVPRFKPLFALASETQEQNEKPIGADLLYMTGSYLWHGDKRGHHEQQKQLRHLRHAAEQYDWEVLKVRIHPREEDSHYEWLKGCKKVILLPRTQDIYDNILGTKIVVGRVSTAVFEAIMLGRVGVLLGTPPLMNMPKVWRNPNIFMPHVTHMADFINNCCRDKHLANSVRKKQRELVGHIISQRTPDAAKIMACHIVNDLEKGTVVDEYCSNLKRE